MGGRGSFKTITPGPSALHGHLPGFWPCSVGTVFIFFSNRVGCLGSIAISLLLSAVLFLAIRSCETQAPVAPVVERR